MSNFRPDTLKYTSWSEDNGDSQFANGYHLTQDDTNNLGNNDVTTAEQILDFENVPPVPSTKQFVGTLRSGSSRFIPDYVDGMVGLPSMTDNGDELFVTRGLLIRMNEPLVGDWDSGRRGGDRSHVALRAYTPVPSPNTATVEFTCMSVWVYVRAALQF